ncbi:hypothetical protein NMG60_11036098 [Bertholletia excelsa]
MSSNSKAYSLFLGNIFILALFISMVTARRFTVTPPDVEDHHINNLIRIEVRPKISKSAPCACHKPPSGKDSISFPIL